MSPTEFDLRAALRDGEGDGVNPDAVIAGGRARLAQRRVRMLTTAAAVVLVTAASAGGVALWTQSGNSSSSSAANAGAGTADRQLAPPNAYGNAGGGKAVAPRPAASTDLHAAAGVAVPCPDSLPRHLLPAGGSPGQFDSTGPLFARPVTSAVVCSYGTSLEALSRIKGFVPARLVLTDRKAKELTASLENAPTSPGATACPDIRSDTERELAIIGVTSDGTTLTTVTVNLTQPACNVRVSNGTALRYRWTPPNDLQTVLASLTPRIGTLSGTLPKAAPSGKNHGSPIRS